MLGELSSRTSVVSLPVLSLHSPAPRTLNQEKTRFSLYTPSSFFTEFFVTSFVFGSFSFTSRLLISSVSLTQSCCLFVISFWLFSPRPCARRRNVAASSRRVLGVSWHWEHFVFHREDGIVFCFFCRFLKYLVGATELWLRDYVVHCTITGVKMKLWYICANLCVHRGVQG